MLRTVPFALASIVLLAAPLSRADTRAVARAGGGLSALDVKVSLPEAAVDANGARLHIDLDRAQLPAEKDVTVEAVAIGDGKHVVHVKVPAKDVEGIAWEALLVAGEKHPIFAGLTGYTAGDPGERTGKTVTIRPSSDGTKSFVLVSDIREDLRICGQA